MIFDSHAHYDDEAFDADRDDVIDKIKKAGVGRVLNCGSSYEGLVKSVELAARYDFIYAAVGMHPEFAGEVKDKIKDIEKLLKSKKVMALGEIGLDYHYEGYDRETQIDAFRRQMDLAQRLDVPVVIHSRDAFSDTLDVLNEFKGVRGAMHCYSGSAEYAKEILKLGYYLGFTGVVTFKNARKTVETVGMMPIEKILVETDCPYMTPVPHRGQRNDSSYLLYTIKKISEIRGLSYDEVCDITYKNACRLYQV